MVDVSIRVATPEELLQDPGLDDASKVELLRRWEFDERQIAVAVEEGMPGPDPPLLQRILQARSVLERRLR